MSKLVQNYLLQQPIGKGVYGQVYRAVHQKTKQLFAVKVIPKSSFRSNPKLQQLAINQINILSSLKHQNIVRFVQTLKTPNNFYFVYEYCNDGTIQNLLQKRQFLKQHEALIIFRQLLQAFKQLNKNNIMHRDLKPDNIFLRDGKVKLGDFGFCKMLEVNMAQTMLGSPIYMAPQILKQQIYTSKADIWSLGVVLFQLLFGYCPFESSSISQLINVIKQTQVVFPKEINPISDKTETLLKKILVKDQFKRIEWVDLFQFKIDESGNIVSGYNKEMGIEALQKYFLNDIKSAGQITIDEPNSTSVRNYQQFKSEQIGNDKFSTAKREVENSTSLKKVLSNDQSTNYLLRSQSLGRAGPGPSIPVQQVRQFNLINFQPVQSELSQNIVLSKQKKGQSVSFLQKHFCWSEALNTIYDLSQRNNQQSEKCIYWMAKSLIDRLSAEYANYPEWTDIIMQQKQQVNLILKELQHLQINHYFDKKNQILKLWTKSNLKGDRLWEKAIRFIFGEEQNSTKTVQNILLR